MLSNSNAMVNIAVKDLTVARKFYEETLGLKVVATYGDMVVNMESGSTGIILYTSEFAGSNKATAMTWSLGEKLDEVVNDLKSKGVTFEKYDMPWAKVENDIYNFDQMRSAWFKDPDGNILSLMN